MNRLEQAWLERNYYFGKKRESIERKIVWKLPHKIIMWAFIRVVLHATNNKWGNTVVPDITAMDALKRWDESNEGTPEPYSPKIGQLNHVEPMEFTGKNASAAPRGPHFSHVNSKGVKYYLNMKYVSLRGGELVPIYYFSKDIRKEASPMPAGYAVKENSRNGFLTVKTKAMIESEQQEEDD